MTLGGPSSLVWLQLPLDHAILVLTADSCPSQTLLLLILIIVSFRIYTPATNKTDPATKQQLANWMTLQVSSL